MSGTFHVLGTRYTMIFSPQFDSNTCFFFGSEVVEIALDLEHDTLD